LTFFVYFFIDLYGEVLFFKKSIYLQSVDSTNIYLKKCEKEDRIVVWTYNQTAGRGRENRKWIDFKDKNLALSVLFEPTEPFNINWYIAATSLSLIDTLDYYGIRERWIKWPNDVYINGKKLAGILAESVWNGNRIDRLIIGIGINVNTEKEEIALIDKKATSVAIEKGSKIDIKEWTERFIQNLSYRFEILLEQNRIDKIKEDWLKESKIIGKKVEWIDINKNVREGIVEDIDNDGFLVLKIGNDIIKVMSGDIALKDFYKNK